MVSPTESHVITDCYQTRKPPMLYTTVFHTDTRLYTMLMVDLGLYFFVIKNYHQSS